jgi:hypothetical protein
VNYSCCLRAFVSVLQRIGISKCDQPGCNKRENHFYGYPPLVAHPVIV